MSVSSEPRSLDDILQADRKKRKAEDLARRVFGKKDRRPSGPAAQNQSRTQSPGASFASRVGINKRSVSSSSVTRPNKSTRPGAPSTFSRSSTVARLESTISQNGNTPAGPNVSRNNRNKGSSNGAAQGELSVRGAAGPYTVVAENFAPGTTAADIETVISSTGSQLESCRLVGSENASVTAELVFLERARVDEVIATFHGKKADGYELNFYLKKANPTSSKAPLEKNPWRVDPDLAQASATGRSDRVDDEVMEIDQETARAAFKEDKSERGHRPGNDRQDRSYTQDYNRDDRRGDGRNDRRPDLFYQDGRQGFGGNPPAGPRHERRHEAWRGGHSRGGGGGRMYSDDLMRGSGLQQPRQW